MSLTKAQQRQTSANLSGGLNYIILKASEGAIVGAAALMGYEPENEIPEVSDEDAEQLRNQLDIALQDALGDVATNPFVAYVFLLCVMQFERIRQAGLVPRKQATTEEQEQPEEGQDENT